MKIYKTKNEIIEGGCGCPILNCNHTDEEKIIQAYHLYAQYGDELVIKKETALTLRKQGYNELDEQRETLDNFVNENFSLLYEGAIRLNCNIESDYYAPRRIQINSTRLHEGQNLKYADGHKYNADYHITEDQIKNTIRDLQILIDEAAKNILSPFQIIISDLSTS